ncbi:MAG: AIR synthase-related protein, partial [Bacteroidota bacterium]
EALAYSGNLFLTDPVEGVDLDAARLVLSPTRTYAPVIAEVLRHHRKDIHGMVHCSGGGQTKVLHFARDLHVIKDNMFPTPPLFRLIQEQSGTSWKEMYQVFNMGHRMELYVPEAIASEIISIAAGFAIDARIVGRCEGREGNQLTIQSEHGNFTYA